MKLQAMLLPTGEFILIGSGCKFPLPAADLLTGLKEASGAAAVLVLEQDVEAADALVDERAKRVEQAKTPDVIVHSLEFTTDIRPGDENLIGQYFGGAEFSPAGLVKSTRDQSAQEFAAQGNLDLAGANTKISAEHIGDELVDAVYEEEPRLDSQTVTKASTTWHSPNQDPGEFGRSPYTGPQEHALYAEDLTFSEDEQWEPRIGQLVRITGPSYLKTTKFIGLVGQIKGVRGLNAHWLVQLPNGSAPFFSVDNIKPYGGDIGG